MPSDIVIEYS